MTKHRLSFSSLSDTYSLSQPLLQSCAYRNPPLILQLRPSLLCTHNPISALSSFFLFVCAPSLLPHTCLLCLCSAFGDCVCAVHQNGHAATHIPLHSHSKSSHHSTHGILSHNSFSLSTYTSALTHLHTLAHTPATSHHFIKIINKNYNNNNYLKIQRKINK